MSFIGKYPPFGYRATGRLERGPYWSEKIDAKGTFYRAPQGGISLRPIAAPAVPNGSVFTYDGGFYLPNEPNEPVQLYEYFSVAKVSAVVPPADVNCTNVSLVRDPSTSKYSLVSFAAAGAAGGAAGGLIGRSIAHGSALSYGQAAGAGAAGGLIGGLIVVAIINSGVGKINMVITSKDPKFEADLRALAAARIPVKEAELPADGELTAPSAGKQSGSP